MVLAAVLPQITISSAPPQEPIPEPSSPFKTTTYDDEGYRPQHLTPPPTHVKFSTNLPSPLGPAENKAKGLERDHFEALLRATRDRNAYAQGKRDASLRKEIALKQHKNKQVQRRALFLSKIMAPPSPTYASQPVTPPESPCLFNWSLPSPGLVSPLALYESLNESCTSGPLSYPVNPWVEQVDYKVPHQKVPSKEAQRSSKTHKSLPSLEQISARLGSNHVRVSSPESHGRTTRLPNFLTHRQPSDEPSEQRPRLSFGSGKLQLPIHSPKPAKLEFSTMLPFPKSPSSSVMPDLQVTTQIVPRSSTLSPTELTESNLQAWESRERMGKDMLATLRRRVITPSDDGMNGHEPIPKPVLNPRWKRHSAPADLIPRPRTGLEHPVLALKGAF